MYSPNIHKTTKHLTVLPTATQAGFSMLEVLVSVVVISIGLLGLAGIQASSLNANNTAYQRTQATLLAHDMMDRMQANGDGVRAGNYNTLLTNTPSAQSCFAVTGGCTPAQIALHDAYEWSTLLAARLPGGKGKVIGSGSDSTFTITVMWDEARTGATGQNCSGDYSVDLYCLTLTTFI